MMNFLAPREMRNSLAQGEIVTCKFLWSKVLVTSPCKSTNINCQFAIVPPSLAITIGVKRGAPCPPPPLATITLVILNLKKVNISYILLPCFLHPLSHIFHTSHLLRSFGGVYLTSNSYIFNFDLCFQSKQIYP